MVKINEPGSGHGDMTSPLGNWHWEYTDEKALAMLKRALFILKNNVHGMKPCNKCFKKLPGGKTFDEILDDDSVWINYEPTDRGWYGITISVGGKDVSISQSAFNKGRCAHVNGASASTGDADKTLLCCGLKNAYEGAIGMNQSGTADEASMAV